MRYIKVRLKLCWLKMTMLFDRVDRSVNRWHVAMVCLFVGLALGYGWCYAQWKESDRNSWEIMSQIIEEKNEVIQGWKDAAIKMSYKAWAQGVEYGQKHPKSKRGGKWK